MNYVKSVVSKARNASGIIKPWNYYKHPEYFRKAGNFRGNKLDHLILMRDLRLWIVENVPHATNKKKYYSELEHIIKEVNFINHTSKILIIFRLSFQNYCLCWFSYVLLL